MKPFFRVALLFIFATLALGVDFLSKSYFYSFFPFSSQPSVSIPVFQNVLGGLDFSLTLALNKGLAWGYFASLQTPILILRIAVILGILSYLFWKPLRLSTLFAFVLIITGALGNVLDYFLYGSVVDFLSFNLWGYHFPVFNFADSYITVGVTFLFFKTLFPKKTPTIVAHDS